MYEKQEPILQRSAESFQEHVEEQLSRHSERTDVLTQQLNLLKEQIQNNTDLLAANTAATNQIQSNTAEIIDAFVSIKSAMKVWEWLGRLAKPAAAVISLGVGVLAAYRAWRGHF